MNIVVQPDDAEVPSASGEQPFYLIQYADGTRVFGQPGTWSEESHLVTLDGVSCYLTKKPITTLSLRTQTKTLTLLALPEPLPCFALARFGVPCGEGGGGSSQGGEHRWLYSLFGYTYHENRFICTVYPGHIKMSIVPVGTSFLE